MARPQDDTAQDTARALRARIESFARTHFGLTGTLRLHRAALGWDLLRAPLNIALAPVFLLAGLASVALRVAGLRRAAKWLTAHRVLLPTSVAREVERLVVTGLLEGAPLNPRSRALIGDYVGVRSAVAEITTSLLVLAAGILLFGAATPGVVSLAPKVSGYVAQSSAVADFWLGPGLGARWYAVFPVTMPVWFIVAIFVALAMAASVVATFAGILADPVQTHLGIHQRRLVRLLDRIAAAERDSAGIEPEHILARLADLTDAGMSLLRFFRS